MVTARKKLDLHLIKAVAVTKPFPKITSTTLTIADTAVVSIMVGKRPPPSTEATDDVVQPMKCIKKKAKKRECEILVIFSQEM